MSELPVEQIGRQVQRLIEGRPSVLLIFVGRNRADGIDGAQCVNDVVRFFELLHEFGLCTGFDALRAMKILECAYQRLLQSGRFKCLIVKEVGSVEIPAMGAKLKIREVAQKPPQAVHAAESLSSLRQTGVPMHVGMNVGKVLSAVLVSENALHVDRFRFVDQHFEHTDDVLDLVLVVGNQACQILLEVFLGKAFGKERGDFAQILR